MSTPGTKRRVISLDVKQKIIARRKEGKTLANLAKKFDLPKQSVQTILSNKEAIQDSIDEGNKDVRSQNIPVTGPLMAEKAKIPAAELAKQIRKAVERKERPFEEANAKLEEKAPMDQGNIENLKVHYRRLLFRARLAAMDNKEEYKVNLLQALHFLRRSWQSVKPETLLRCFKKAGFMINEQEENEILEGVQEDIEELNQMFEKLVAAEETDSNYEVEVPDLEEEMEVEIIEEEQPVTARDALNAFKIFQRYMETHEVDPAMLRKCDELDDFLAKECLKKMKQNPITNFFRPHV
uniref:HTH psq-type domain-containing protein n=1 Tax=Ditylenchus dipsaci TaxID=166011 RepID=A0A915E725_9BILA